jgi:arsenite oxidase small subunit
MKKVHQVASYSSPHKSFGFRGHRYSSGCLNCNDLVNCCGNESETEFDGASSNKAKVSRRDFIKIMGGVSAVLAAAPFAVAQQYLIPPIPTSFQPVLIAKKQDVPVNESLVFWFPFTTDPTYTNMLIHLPPDLASQAGREFVAYNRTCIHLQCLVSFLSGSEIIGCPCHGSIYRPTDGWPIGGPAAEIGRYLPNVQLKIDGDDIYAVNINLSDIGYGNTSGPA